MLLGERGPVPDYRYEHLDEPEWSVTREELEGGVYYVLAWLQPDSIEIESDSGIRKYTTPPFQYESQSRILPGERNHVVARLKSLARQVKDYLVWRTLVDVPLLCKLMGKDLLTTEFLSGEDYASTLTWRHGFRYQESGDFYHLIESMHRSTTQLLDSVERDSLIDKAICLWSEGFLSMSRQIKLLRFWSILDVFAEAHAQNTGQMIRGPGRKLKEAIQMIEDLDLERDVGLLREAYRLRNKVAHGEVSSVLDEEIEGVLQDIGEVSRILIERRFPQTVE